MKILEDSLTNNFTTSLNDINWLSKRTYNQRLIVAFG